MNYQNNTAPSKMKPKYKEREFFCLGCKKNVRKRMPAGRKYCSAECFRKAGRPNGKTGKVIICEVCGTSRYKEKCHLHTKNHFCSIKCANIFQARNKLTFNCKICKKEFKWSKSRIKQANPVYCSITCRNNDIEHMRAVSLKGNTASIAKRGLTKLEVIGNNILNQIGCEYKIQIPMFNKFTVDVVIESKKLIIQWDGSYWHSFPKRKKLDVLQDAELENNGYKVLRITDKEIKKNIKQVYKKIRKALHKK